MKEEYYVTDLFEAVNANSDRVLRELEAEQVKASMNIQAKVLGALSVVAIVGAFLVETPH